ncbi:hypothetical protein HMPREF0541_01136 [Lacticaseibacillus rhamnosus ATCC 21052]|nr:hypothetical protein HMPREF0541_01136 [Lacticaseibacillus rhamnosus ATCC 21052]
MARARAITFKAAYTPAITLKAAYVLAYAHNAFTSPETCV